MQPLGRVGVIDDLTFTHPGMLREEITPAALIR
jgi:hypothetical protein